MEEEFNVEIAIRDVNDVKVVQLEGELDTGSSPETQKQLDQLREQGAKKILLDLAKLDFISSAGLASLQIITKMFKEEKSDSDSGWGTNKDSDQGKEKMMQAHVKLYNPSPDVDNVLDTVGFKQFFEVFSDMEEALNSFE